MSLPIVLAHGVLGYWDEMIFLGVVVVFLVMMGLNWVRSRAEAPDPDPAVSASSSSPDSTPSDAMPSSGDRFQLD